MDAAGHNRTGQVASGLHRPRSGRRPKQTPYRSSIYTEQEDGLNRRWAGRVFCNPPFGRAAAVARKAHRAWKESEAECVLMLQPARVNVGFFHECVAGVADVIFLKGRVRFHNENGEFGSGLPMPICLALWGDDDIRQRFPEVFSGGAHEAGGGR